MNPLITIGVISIILMIVTGALNFIIGVDKHPKYRKVAEKILLFLTGVLFTCFAIFVWSEFFKR